MSDTLIRGYNDHLRYFAADTTQLVATAARLHNFNDAGTVIMGRLLTAALLVAGSFKNDDDLVTLSINAEGPVGGGLVTASPHGWAKGYLHNPSPQPAAGEKARLRDLVGPGVLTVMRTLGGAPPYVGQTELVSGEIAQDLAHYYRQSEQIPTAVSLGVNVDGEGNITRAGGFLVQLLPGAPDDVAALLEENIAQTPWFTDMQALGHSPQKIMTELVLKGLELTPGPDLPLTWQCDCSHERFLRGIALLSAEEIHSLIEEDKPAEVECRFCKKMYRYGPDELRGLLAHKEKQK